MGGLNAWRCVRVGDVMLGGGGCDMTHLEPRHKVKIAFIIARQEIM